MRQQTEARTKTLAHRSDHTSLEIPALNSTKGDHLAGSPGIQQDGLTGPQQPEERRRPHLRPPSFLSSDVLQCDAQ